MITAKPSTKYQIVIPKKIRQIIKIIPGEEVIIDVDKNREYITIKPKIKNWAKYMRGLGKEVWQGIDTEKFHKEFKESFDYDIWKK